MLLNRDLPHNPFVAKRLPGVAPLDPARWLYVSDTHAGQMAKRDALLAAHRDAVVWADPRACDALEETLALVLDALPEPYRRTAGAVVRPDGVTVPLDPGDVLGTLTRLVQEDMVIMTRRGSEHVLDAATLCFPSSWRLHQKKARPMISIHRPVASYTADVATRVQRLFDGVRPGRPLTRYNCIWSPVPDLFNPQDETAVSHPVDDVTAPFLRSERQCILRLPQSGSALFSIHTFMVGRARALALQAAA